MSIATDLKRLTKNAKPPKKRTGPLWKGPEVDGITFSLLSRFLCCRERFRILVVEGLKPVDTFYAPMEFGNMWHVCEEALAKGRQKGWPWEAPLKDYCQRLCQRYPMQQEQVNHWYEMAKDLFPIYVDYWSKHPDVKERTPLLQEQVFDVPYKLPSGRTVRLRGKWDSVDLIGRGKSAGIYLQENKTKSSIDGTRTARQLSFDLQTMMYLVALESSRTKWCEHPCLDPPTEEKIEKANYRISAFRVPIRGVRYNVIRRSAHKSVESMLKKLEEDRSAGRIGEWFARWKVEISVDDVARFRRECFDPILENLCNWWETVRPNGAWTQVEQDAAASNQNWRHPFGVWNVLDEGGSSDLDAYLETGSEVGLRRAENLFEELV